jgi:hypothetical protein
MTVPAGAPLLVAIWAAVWPFPYRFDESLRPAETVLAAVTPLLAVHVALEPLPPPVVHCVLFAVLFAGFTPAWADVFEFALVLLETDVVDDDFVWPGAFAEFPWVLVDAEAEALPETLALAPPLPLPARAEAVNVASATVSTSAPTAPVKRLIISFSPRSRTIVPSGLSRLQTR